MLPFSVTNLLIPYARPAAQPGNERRSCPASDLTHMSDPRPVMSQPAHSVIQFVIPKGKPTVLTRAPTDDASVYAGANQHANYGSSQSLNVALSSTGSQSSTSASFIKFGTSGVAASNVRVKTKLSPVQRLEHGGRRPSEICTTAACVRLAGADLSAGLSRRLPASVRATAGIDCAVGSASAATHKASLSHRPPQTCNNRNLGLVPTFTS